MTLIKYKAIPFAAALLLLSMNPHHAMAFDHCQTHPECVVEVPEPSSVAIFAIGIMALVLSGRKKK